MGERMRGRDQGTLAVIGGAEIGLNANGCAERGEHWAVEKLDGREQQVVVADVLQVVDHELACVESELLYVAGPVSNVRDLTVIEVRAAVAARDGGPEVIEHMGVEAQAVARFEMD